MIIVIFCIVVYSLNFLIFLSLFIAADRADRRAAWLYNRELNSIEKLMIR